MTRDRSTSAESTWEYEAIQSWRKLGRKLSYNCFFMCTLSLRHEGARMLFSCEEKEIPYPVGLVIFIGEGEKTPMAGAGSLKRPVPER